MPNGSETPDRLERLAALLRECPVSDRTDGFIASWAIIMQRIVETSPDDQAEAATALARAMGRG